MDELLNSEDSFDEAESDVYELESDDARRGKARRKRRSKKRKPTRAKRRVTRTRPKPKTKKRKRKSIRKEVRKAKKDFRKGKITEAELKEKYKKAPRKLRKKLGRAVKRIKTRRKILFTPLIPLTPVLKKGLRRKGIDTKGMKFYDVVMAFYNSFVVKASKGTYELIDAEDFYCDYEADTALPVVTAIITGIVSFIKSIKKKKASGEPLTPTEKTIATTTEKVEEIIEEKAKEEIAGEIGERILFDTKTQLMIAGGVILLFVIIKKFGK